MNRLGKTVELIVKLETIFDEEAKDEQRSKLKDQLETRGLEAARDHEMLELDGTPQDIVDFRRKIAPILCLHACPHCGDEMDPRGSSVIEDARDYKFVCWECEESFMPASLPLSLKGYPTRIPHHDHHRSKEGAQRSNRGPSIQIKC